MVDISKWPLGRIEGLPDQVFGRRYPVSCFANSTGAATAIDVSEEMLPQRIMVWQLHIAPGKSGHLSSYVRIGLADDLPADEDGFMKCVPLIRGFGAQGPEPRQITGYLNYASWDLYLRMGVVTGGRRLALLARSGTGGYAWAHVTVVVSSVPEKVPKWAISAME